NPTPVEGAKAVPSIDPVEAAGGDVMAAALAMTQPAAEPVDLPSKEDLDAEVEAEIEAALSNDSPAAQVTVQTVDGEEEELTEETLEEGARLTGTVQSVDAENIFLDIGVRSPAIIQLRHIEAAKVPAVGDKLEVIVNRIEQVQG
nr:S1 RNA-binding domain-containing protein [Planctomycetota bacterium]